MNRLPQDGGREKGGSGAEGGGVFHRDSGFTKESVTVTHHEVKRVIEIEKLKKTMTAALGYEMQIAYRIKKRKTAQTHSRFPRHDVILCAFF